MPTPYTNHPVFKHFEAISRIPHGSGDEKAISDYILHFAQNLGLEAVRDEVYNLVIRKPATPGYEQAPIVMLQGHLDMVCEKNMDVVHDFTCDPLRLIVDGDILHADGTTLGADDGVAVAMCMALMADNTLRHPALELVLTANEEVGLVGATVLSPDLLRGDIMINLDSGEEGIFLTSCAGGLKQDIGLPIAEKSAPAASENTAVALRVTGLMGGHSGIDIDKNRGNSIRILTQLLQTAVDQYGAQLASLTGGSKDNAIPREAEAIVIIPRDMHNALANNISAYNAEIRKTYAESDADVSVSMAACETFPATVLEDSSTNALLCLLSSLPCGVLSYSAALPGLVETSNNVGVVSTEPGIARIICALRSSVAAAKHTLAANIRILVEEYGANVQAHGEYPAWEYNPNSKIRQLAVDVYEETTGKPAQLLAVHAGLECGLFAEKRPGLDMIALGPDMFDIHSPAERLSLSSLMRTWDLLLEILSRITA